MGTVILSVGNMKTILLLVIALIACSAFSFGTWSEERLEALLSDGGRIIDCDAFDLRLVTVWSVGGSCSKNSPPPFWLQAPEKIACHLLQKSAYDIMFAVPGAGAQGALWLR